MAEMVKTVETFLGFSCDMPSCSEEFLVAGGRIAHVPLWGPEFVQFEKAAFLAGWSLRIVRSRRWYCPAHEENAYADVVSRWGSRRPPRNVRGQDVREAANAQWASLQ